MAKTIDIRAQITLDKAGAAETERFLQRLGHATKSAGADTGAARAFKATGDAARQAERDTLRYATAMASAQRATGDQAGAVSTLRGALASLTPNTIEAHQAVTRLAQAEKQLASGAGAQFAQSFKDGLLGIVGPAAAATAAIAAVGTVLRATDEAFQLKASLDATKASINAQLTGVRDLNEVYSQASAFGREFKLTQQETTEAVQASIGVMRASKAPVEDILSVLARMQVLSPEQSLQEAAIALKALASGDTTSLVTRFEVSRDKANEMKAEIQGGADAVQVMSQFLTNTGIGMDALKAKTEGAAGAIADAKIQAEQFQLALAGEQGGLGLELLEAKTTALRAATRLLTSDTEAMRQSVTQATSDGASGFNTFSAAIAAVSGNFAPLIQVQQASAQASMEATDAALTNAMASAQQAAAAQQSAVATAEEAAVKQAYIGVVQAQEQATLMASAAFDEERAAAAAIPPVISDLTNARYHDIDAITVHIAQQQASELAGQSLANVQATLADLGGQVANGLMTAGNAALVLAQQYNIAYNSALALVQAQAMLGQAKMNAAALADQRAGERSGGAFRTVDEVNRVTQAERRRAQEAQRAAEQMRQADLAIARAKGDTAGQVAMLRQQQQGLNKSSAEYKNIEAQILGIQRQGGRARGAGGGGRAGGGRGGAAGARASQAEQTTTRLQDIERQGGKKIEEINEQTQQKIAAIEQKYAEKRAAAARQLADDIARANASTRFDQELNDFDRFQKDLSDEQRAALADREAAEQEYNAKVAQYQEEARQQAASGDAELAQDILAARTEQARKEKEIAERAAEARRAGGDAAAVAAEAQQATEAARQQAETEIAIAQAKAQERAGAEQAEKDAVIAAAQEQAAKVISAAEDQAAKVKGASDGQRATVISNLQAQAAAVKAWADTITGAAGQAQRAMDGVTGPPTPESGDALPGEGGGDAAQGFRRSLARSASGGGGGGGSVADAIQTLNDAAEIIKVIKPFVAANKGAVKLLNEYSLTVRSAVGSLLAIQDLRNRLVQPAPVLDINQVLALKADIERVLTIMMSIDASATSKVRVFAKYLETEKAAIDILNSVMELRKSLAMPTPPITPEYVLTLIATANGVIGLLFSQLIPLKQREVDGLKTYADAVGAGIGILRDVADLRKELADQAGVAPFNMALIRGLVQRAAEITRLVETQLVPLTERQAEGFSAYATAASAAIEIIRGTADLRKELSDQKNVTPFDMALIKGLAMRAREITQLVLAQLIPFTEDQAAAMERYGQAQGAAVDILRGTADLRKELAEAPPGAIDLRIVRALAADANQITQTVLGSLLPVSEEETAALQRYADSQGAAVGVIKETADLRMALAEGVGAPVDVRAIERLADDAKRITEIVLARALPASEETAEAARRYADTNGAAINVLRDTLGLTSDLFANYQSPTDAQLNLIVRDSQRIVDAITRAAAVYDEEGLAKAKAFGEAQGAIVGAFIETAKFNEGLLFSPAVSPPADKLAEFERGSLALMDVASRLATRAAAIPPNSLAALTNVTSALTAQADMLLRMASVPFGDLAGLANTYGGVMGGATTINIYTLPGQNEKQIADMVISRLNQQYRGHR